METIKDNEMPLKSYTIIHSNAKLSDSDKQEIEAWEKKIKSEIQ
ncbi:MAG: heme-binding domain-containing protein [Bacteroidota bacterium]